MDGTLNIYFPGQLKDTSVIKRTIKKWRLVRERQLELIRRTGQPLTDLLDLDYIRRENDAILNSVRKIIECESLFYIHDYDNLEKPTYLPTPYATKCLFEEYTYSRESKIHSKEVSCIISKFDVLSQGIKKVDDENTKIHGRIIFSINLDSKIATFIVVIEFRNLNIEDIIRLKHCFYKRYKLSITSWPLNPKEVCAQCPAIREIYSSVLPKVKGINNPPIKMLLQGDSSLDNKRSPKTENTTFQDFIFRHLPISRSLIKTSFDARARYSILEINDNFSFDPSSNENIIRQNCYGLLTADENYQLATNTKLKTMKYEIRSASVFLYQGLNCLIFRYNSKYSEKITTRENMFSGLNPPSYHIRKNKMMKKHCVAGVGLHIYAPFLKAVEMHYLTNMAFTDDIEVRDQSFWNPFIFVKRSFTLSKILYEEDLHREYYNKTLFESFDLNDTLKRIREENSSILTHTMAYSTVLLTIAMTILMIIQLINTSVNF